MRLREIVFFCGWAALLAGCATTQKHTVKVATTPADALVTVCTKAAKQIMEGIADAEELAHLK
jgi:hypothetical protein